MDEEEMQEGQEEQQDAEQEEQQEQQQKLKIQERILKVRLKALNVKLKMKSSVALTGNDNTLYQKAKKNKNLASDCAMIDATLSMNMVKNASKAMSSTPGLQYVLIFSLIIFVAICFIAIIYSIFGGTSEFGITGTDFYGARVVYKDDEKSVSYIVEDYVELLGAGIEHANNQSLTNLNITINIELPDEEYSYEDFDEAEFASSYPVAYSTALQIANLVYKVDNGAAASGSLVETINGIKYFGVVKVDEDGNGSDDVAEIITKSILDYSTFKNKDATNPDLNASDVENARNQITSSLQALYSQEKYSQRAEKLFVKDYILTGEEKLKGMSSENYVAFIFMPKKDVSFSKLSFAVSGSNLNDFKITLKENGNELNLKKDDSDYSTDEGTSNFIYSTTLFVTVPGFKFADIDESNTNALSEGMSLMDIVLSEELDYTIYLKSETNENGVQYLTIKKNGVVVELENSEKFNFSEFETEWD